MFFLLYTHKPHNKVLLIGNNDIIFDPAIYYTAVSFFPVSPSPVKYVVFFTFVFLTSFYEKEKEIWKAWEIEYLEKREVFTALHETSIFSIMCRVIWLGLLQHGMTSDDT